MAIPRRTYSKKYFTNEIIDAVIDLINSNTELDSPVLKVVSQGDLSLLPQPEDIQNFLPALLIDVNDIYSTDATGTKSIMSNVYEYSVRYLKYYNEADSFNEKRDFDNISDLIASTLLDDQNLTEILKSDDKYKELLNSGSILKTETSIISHNDTESSIFKDLKVPVMMCTIRYLIYYRTMKKR